MKIPAAYAACWGGPSGKAGRLAWEWGKQAGEGQERKVCFPAQPKGGSFNLTPQETLKLPGKGAFTQAH